MSNYPSPHHIRRKPVPQEITGLMDDLEVASKSFSQGAKAVLQVIDAPYDGTAPQKLAEFSFDDDIAEGMKSLPPHDNGTARILDITTHSDFIITGLREKRGPERTRAARDVLIKFLQDTYTQPFEERRIFRWLNDPVLVNDIGSIKSQWSQRLGGGDTNFYRLVNRTSLQQDPMDYDLHPRDSYLTCAQDADGRLIAIIVNDVWSGQTFNVNAKSPDNDILFQNPRSISKILAGDSWTSFSDGTVDTFAKFLLLDFFLASIYLQPVDYYSPLIYSQLPEREILKVSLTKNPHLQVPLGLFEPRLSAKSKDAFREIEHAEGILRSLNNLVASIRFVVKAIEQNNAAGIQQSVRKDYERRLQELEGLCDERGGNAKMALEALNRQLDYLTKRHSIREAKAIKVLTILASLYLPLSLSASILGVQTPFKQVAHTRLTSDNSDQNLVGTNLLFDFFGVFIGLATVTIFILYTIRLGLWMKSEGLGIISKHFSSPFSIFYYGKRWRFGGRGGQIFEIIQGLTAWCMGGGLCVILVLVFLVGMLKSAQNAWDIAKNLFLAYLVVSVVLLTCYVGTYWRLYAKRFWRR